jgi:D-glycero-D-manno-heptose 1,7-bisphosphate phosphatase
MFDLQLIDKSWTLFLDRDGVLNDEKKDNYVLNWEQFKFLDGVKDALKILNDQFGITVIITNQKCIGKGLLSLEGLHTIHYKMINEIIVAGGRIDKIYFCPDLNNDSTDRKPNIGMAIQAKHDFPAIDFSKTIMVGNKLSDMEFGRNAGIKTVFIASTNPDTPFPHSLIDLRFNSLSAFAEVLTKS